MSTRCPRCGATNPTRATICAHCKTPLQTAASRMFLKAPGRSVLPRTASARPTLYASGTRPSSSFSTGMLASHYLLAQRYRILHRVGKGGMGAVYKAEDTRLGNRLVAVKEMSQSHLLPHELSKAIEDFKQEALLLARLRHPNLPRIYDHFHENGRWYLVMDFIDGETLAEYLRQTSGGQLPVHEVLTIGIQLSAVLDYLHTRQPPIIFRDLKPANVMRTPEGDLYLIDFGIARHFKADNMFDTAPRGTQGYAAPELYSQQSTSLSDIYSLGATLHQLLSGSNPSQTLFHFAALRPYNYTVPLELERLIMQMVAMEPDNRPASMTDIHQHLQDISVQLAERMHSAGRGPLRQKLQEMFGSNDSVQESTATLYVEEGEQAGQIYELRKKYSTIGRNYDNDIYLKDTLVSRHHASITRREDGTYLLCDEGSANGTTVDGWRLEIGKNYTLEDEATIQLGRTVLIFRKN